MILPATSLVPGEASGPVFALSQPLSFWGGFDATSGRIIDRSHPEVGARLSAHVLLMTAGRGSSSGSSVLAEAIRLRTAPCAIVLLTRDAIVTVGAIVATELYRSSCPVVLARDSNWHRDWSSSHRTRPPRWLSILRAKASRN
jgi:predicted aconitase with swiveling domain